MKRVKTKILAFIATILGVSVITIASLHALASEGNSREMNKIELFVYNEENHPISGVNIETYKIADYDGSNLRPGNVLLGTFLTIEDFKKSDSLMLNTIQERIDKINAKPLMTCTTNVMGKAIVNPLIDGVYYIKSSSDVESHNIHPFIVVFPIPGEDNGVCSIKCYPSHGYQTKEKVIPEEIEDDTVELKAPEPVIIVIDVSDNNESNP